MNRRDFLKRIGLGTAAVVAIPTVLISLETTAQVVTGDSVVMGTGIFEQMRNANVHSYNLTKADIEKAVNDVFSEPYPKQDREFKIYTTSRKGMEDFHKALKREAYKW